MITPIAEPTYGMRYLFYPKAYPQAPGYPRLDIVLRDNSVDLGCQPLSLRVNVADADQIIKNLTLYHGGPLEADIYRVSAGRLLVFEQDGQVMQVFTFGGKLSITTSSNETRCTITSSAPLIPMQIPHLDDNLPCVLIEAVEALLAQRHAEWGTHSLGYLKRLALADPQALYNACLDRLHCQFRPNLLDIERDFAVSFRGFLRSEMLTLEMIGKWPAVVCALEDIL